ncbi:MAG: tetratricopeptide repeat protein [Candidatus Neomarinimicrobiota bacterium]
MSHKVLIRLLVLLILLGGGPSSGQAVWKTAKAADQPEQKTATTKKRPPQKQPTSNKPATPPPTGTKTTTGKTATRPTSGSKTSAGKSTTTRPSTKSGTTTKNQPARQTATGSKQSTRKQPAATAKTRKRPPATTQTAPTRKASTRPRPTTAPVPTAAAKETVIIPSVNVVKMADEIYSLTDQLTSSQRQMRQAAAYLEPLPKRQMVRLESRPAVNLADLEMQAAADPENIKLQRQLALEYENRQEIAKAKDIYLRMVYNQPENADAHYFLGSFYAARNESDKARQAYEEALIFNPDHQATLNALAAFPGNRRQLSSSVPTAPAKSDPARDKALFKMNEIKRELDAGNARAAIQLASVAEVQFPDQSGFVFLKGRAYQTLGETDLAKAEYHKTLKINPRQIEAHRALAALYFDQGNYLYAALSYQQVIAQNPLSTDDRYRLGLAYYLAGEWGHAAAVWEDLLHYAPNHVEARGYLPQAYYVLAMEYNRLGESGLGRTAFNKALSVNSDAYTWLPGALTTLGKHYRDREMYKESLAAFQEAIELRPKSADVYTEIGVTYWKMNEKRLARAAWQRSLELNPGNNTAQGWLILSRQIG